MTESYLTNLATQAGLNLSQWKTDRNDPALANQVNSDQSAARQVGVSGTPTLIMTGPKGQAVAGANSAVPTYAQLEQAVKQVS